MNDAEIRRLQMYARVRDYLAMRAESISLSVLGGVLFVEIGKIVDELSKHAKTQETSSAAAKEGTGHKAVLREELYEGLMAIYRTARAIAIKKPNFDDKFLRPPKDNDQLLLKSARSYAETAVAFVEDFLRYDMPKDFIDQLNKNIALFEKAIIQRNQGTSAQVAATEAIDEAIDRGMIVVRELDAIIRNKFSNDSSALAAWFRARHTERASKSAPVQDAPSTESNN